MFPEFQAHAAAKAANPIVVLALAVTRA